MIAALAALILALLAPPPVAVAYDGGTVAWAAPPTQAHAVVVVRRAGVDVFAADAGAASSYAVRAEPGDVITVTLWDEGAALLGVGRAVAPWRVWLAHIATPPSR